MKPVSKFSIVVTILAVVVIGWIVFTHHDRPTPSETTPTTPTTVGTWPSVEVSQKTISDSNQYYTIDAVYPVTSDTGINDQFKAFVEDQITQFKEDTAWVTDPEIESAGESNLALSISYKEERSSIADNYVFIIGTYTGGAHGLQVTRTFAFDQHGAPIALSDLFKNPDTGLKTVATFVQKEIEKKKISDSQWIAQGAGPTEENYRNFTISDAGVTFIFDPYQVAPYASGIQNILVPMSTLKSVANPTLFR